MKSQKRTKYLEKQTKILNLYHETDEKASSPWRKTLGECPPLQFWDLNGRDQGGETERFDSFAGE